MIAIKREKYKDPIRKHLKGFRIMEIILHCRAIETIRLGPDIMKGNRIRGGFGPYLKAVCCMRPEFNSCEPCGDKRQCLYFLVFSDNTPHPYVLKQTFDGKERYEKDDIFSFRLVLMGAATAYMYRFIRAFELLGDRKGIGQGHGRFEIRDAWPESIYEPQQFFGGRKLKSANCKLNLLTPMCLTDERHGIYTVAEPFPFPFFVRSLVGRIVNLTNLYEYDGAATSDAIQAQINQITEMAEQIRVTGPPLTWYEGERHPSHKEKPEKLQGFLGELRLEGELSSLMPYLRVGEIIGTGSRTSIGFGRFEVITL